MSTAATKRNGKPTTSAVCRHSPGCEVAQTQRDLQAQVQAFSETIGEGLEQMAISLEHIRKGHESMLLQQERHNDRLLSIANHLANVAERQTVSSQREAEWMKQLNELTSVVSRIAEGADA